MKKIELLKKFTEYSKLKEFMVNDEIEIVEIYGTKPFEVENNKGEWTAKYVTNLPKFNTIEGNPFYIESENHDTNEYYLHLSNEWEKCDAELIELYKEQGRLKDEIEAMLLSSGFRDIKFSKMQPHWCAICIKGEYDGDIKT